MSATGPAMLSDVTVAIAGGGIAGLALARGLQQRGFPGTVRVFEASATQDANPQGYSLTLQTVGRKALIDLGVWEAVRAMSTKSVNGQLIIDARDGKEMLRLGGGKGQNSVYLPWQSLREALLESLEPGTVVWGHPVDSCKLEADACVLELSTGHSVRCQMLVACDGIFSKVRQAMLGDPPNYLGVVSINGITTSVCHSHCSHGNLQALDGNARLFAKPFDGTGRAMWQLTFPVTDEPEAAALNHASQEQLAARARAVTSKWKTDVLNMLEDTPADGLQGGAMYDRDPELCGTLLGDGRVVLIGDAAHPMSPFKGQGANQALVDSVQLAQVLLAAPIAAFEADHESKVRSEFKESLQKFHNGMQHRVRPKVLGSRWNVEFYHTPEALEQEALRVKFSQHVTARGLQPRQGAYRSRYAEKGKGTRKAPTWLRSLPRQQCENLVLGSAASLVAVALLRSLWVR